MHTDLIWDLTILFTGLGFVYFLVIFFFRNRLSQKAKEVARRKQELGPMISNFLFYEDDATNIEKVEYFNLKLQIRELLKDDLNRKVLVEILLDLQKDIAGDAAHRLSALYRNLGLHLDAFDSLKSRRWEVVSRGILELTQLQVDESYGFIRKFINHKRGVIRKQAQIATVSLKHEGISYFLDTNKYRISEWQQLKLMDEIRNLEDFTPPRFRAWLTSRNRDVVLFSLRLIKFYKQNDANASLIELVKHRNNQIKIEAIECIKEFCVQEALDTLKAVFRKCNAEVKIQILDAIGQMGQEEEIEFLRKAENKETNFLVKSKIVSAINCISPGSVLPTKDIVSTSGTETDPVPGADQDVASISEKMDDLPLTEKEEQEELTPVPNESQVAFETLEVMAEADESVNNNNHVSQDPPDTPDEWEISLDPENEDTEIFEICFMEELRDILSESEYSNDPSEEAGVLPIGFLPVVTEEAVLQESIPAALLDIEVISEEISEDAKFRLELDGMLQRIRIMEDSAEDNMVPNQAPAPEIDPHDMETVQDIAVPPGDPAIPEAFINTEDNDVQPIEDQMDGIEMTPSNSGQENDRQGGEVLLLPEGKKTSSQNPAVSQEFPEPRFGIHETITENTEPDEFASGDSGEDQLQDMATDDTAYSGIFHELFRRADTESKLILLDEILEIGDERDLHFINALTTSPIDELRDKAILLSGQLQDIIARRQALKSECPEDKEFTGSPPEAIPAKVALPEGKSENYVDGRQDLDALEECHQPDTGDMFNMFEVEFELTREDPDQVAADGSLQTAPNTLLDSILSIPVKIIDKFNG